jgi:hypothetical protein
MLVGQSTKAPGDFGPSQTATVFSSVDRSEWCPAGNVQIDLATGEFALISGASRDVCNEANLKRPIKRDRLGKKSLAKLRSAYRRVQGEGLDVCQDGVRPDGMIIASNGGPAILVLTDGARTTAAPDDLSCWSDAAFELSDTLEDVFGSYGGR